MDAPCKHGAGGKKPRVALVVRLLVFKKLGVMDVNRRLVL